mmetsp:Transcript_13982/g.27739  ORF Transcript_13982/g.27739 Transcript_13982/m.27739 type:complete len:240 (-) Transcript_13982:1827-2546(-)
MGALRPRGSQGSHARHGQGLHPEKAASRFAGDERRGCVRGGREHRELLCGGHKRNPSRGGQRDRRASAAEHGGGRGPHQKRTVCGGGRATETFHLGLRRAASLLHAPQHTPLPARDVLAGVRPQVVQGQRARQRRRQDPPQLPAILAGLDRGPHPQQGGPLCADRARRNAWRCCDGTTGPEQSFKAPSRRVRRVGGLGLCRQVQKGERRTPALLPSHRQHQESAGRRGRCCGAAAAYDL